MKCLARCALLLRRSVVASRVDAAIASDGLRLRVSAPVVARCPVVLEQVRGEVVPQRPGVANATRRHDERDHLCQQRARTRQ